MDKLNDYRVMLGADPEFFFSKGGKIIGSEKVINSTTGISDGYNKRVIVDGVQAELNPAPAQCREFLRDHISLCFRLLYAEMQKKDPELKLEFKPSVEVTKAELATLDERSQVFGCSPSKNAAEESGIKVNPKTYLHRGAGGHIHLSPAGLNNAVEAFKYPERLVAILDILLGNTCVLLDRDEGNIERRKVYGKAGEYRTPAHGLEYRVLSNFWLRSYPLMSFVMGLARQSVSVLASSLVSDAPLDFEKELLELVNMKDIRKAINENNYTVALKNYKRYRPFILKRFPESFVIHSKNILAFEFFFRKGLDFWFKGNPMDNWLKEPRGWGWENWLGHTVKPEMRSVTGMLKRMVVAIREVSH